MEAVQRSYNELSPEEQKAHFAKNVHSAFNELLSRGMEPNEACALALKVAAGVAELPPTPDDLARRLRDDSSTPLGQLCAHVTRFFANGDCLQAAFWPKKMAVPVAAPLRSSTRAPGSAGGTAASTAASDSTVAAAGGRSSGSGAVAAAASTALPVACPLDFTAVAALYDSVLGYRSSTTGGASASGEAAASATVASTSAAAATAAASTSGRPGSAASTALGSLLGSTLGSTLGATLAGGELSGPSAALGSALAAGVEGLLSALSNLPHSVNPGLSRQLGVLLANPLLDRGEHHDLLGSLVAFIGGLSQPQRRALVELFTTYPPDEMRRLLSRLHSFISLTLFRMQSITRGVEDATRLVALLYEANEEAGKRAAAAAEAAGVLVCLGPGNFGFGMGGGPGSGEMDAVLSGTAGCGPGFSSGGLGGGAGWRPLEPAAFYNDAINHEDFNLKEDFRKWKHPHKYDFCFCKFPFMYDPGSKARILQMENQMSQVNELHTALFRGLFGGVGNPLSSLTTDVCPFLVLRVRRGPYLVQDTLIQIHRAKETDSLKKPLKVKFIGEEGVDEGGVAKEFFQLLVRQLFNPDYGMFTADPTSHLHWFRPSKLEMELEFELVGILIGLAIYNSHILEFQFPPVLYKKLMGAKVAVSSDLANLGANLTAALPPPPGGAGGPGAAAAGAGAAAAAGGGGAAAAAAAAAAGRGLTGTGAGLGAAAGGGLAGRGGGVGWGGLGGAGVGASQQLNASMPQHHLGENGVGVLGLEDLRDLAPEVSSSLVKLLQMPPEMVEDLGLVFQVDMEVGFGEVEQVDLVPGGADLPVTAANRRLYVDLYVKHLLEDSIAGQFAPFQRGFLRLCSGAALGWFSPAELELLVCGSRQLALSELEGATQYDDGYTKDSEPVRWFWEVVHALPPASQKRLLFFVTGSDRVPIKGLAHLNPPFVISRAGAHSDRLPSAHTCFNHLLLPHYNCKEVLKERLELALQNAEGFGLM